MGEVYIAGADVIAAAAFNAFRQPQCLQLVGVMSACGLQHKLRGEEGRANCRAVAAIDARECGSACRFVLYVANIEAVAGFGDRCGVIGQRHAHHGTSHDYLYLFAGVSAGQGDQLI